MINVVTKSGHRPAPRIGGAVPARQQLAGRCRRPSTARSGESLPFDRQQIAGSAGGPIVAGKAFWFGAAEYRNQDGAVLVGTRDVPTRTITRGFAPAPLDDFLFSGRADWRPSDRDDVGVPLRRRARDRHAAPAPWTARSARPRSGSAARTATTRSSARGRASSVRTLLNALTGSFSTFDNAIAPVAGGPQLTFPSIQDGSSFRVPQGTTQKRFQIADSVTMVRGAHTIRAGGEWQRIDALFDLGVFLDGRIEMVEDFADFDHNGDGRVDDNDLLFAVTLRSGKPDQALVIPDADNNYFAFYVAGRLARPARPHAEPRPAVGDGHRRQEHQPLRRDQPDRPAVPAGRAQARLNNFGAAHRLQLGARRRPVQRPRRLRHLLRPHHARDPVARARPRRARAADRGEGRQRVLPRPEHRPVPAVRALDQQPVHRLHPDRRRRLGDQHHRQHDAEPERPAVEPRRREGPAARRRAARRRRAQPRHALHHRPHRSARCSTRSSAARIASSTSSRA